MASDLDYENEGSDTDYSESGSGSGSGGGSDHEEMEEGEIDDPPGVAADQLARVTGLTFCPTHRPDFMVEM